MIVWTKSELIEALSEELIEHHNLDNNLEIDEVVIDSRKTPKSGLFIALKGENNDGHNFLNQAFQNGCVIAIIDQKRESEFKQFILVKNSFTALYKLAEFSRKRSKAKIIAITGSVGKTSTKEMLKLVFENLGKTFSTFGNLNNHIGLPLSLCNFSAICEYGIFEIGMNHLGEIEPLAKLTKPHIAVVTNVGPVHIEFFENEKEIALAKSEIFAGLSNDGIALINRDNKHYEFLQNRAKSNQVESVTFGLKNLSDYQITEFSIKNATKSEVKAKLKNGLKISYEISSSNIAIIFNSIIAIACLDLFKCDIMKAVEALKNLESYSGRGKIIETKIDQKNITIIDDSYNASAPSMYAGLQHASNLKIALNKKRVVAALGDMLELGKKSIELHNEIIDYLLEFNIDFSVLVGEKIVESAKNLPDNSYKTFLNSFFAALEIKDLLQDGDILYVKGSRGMKMEKIIETLINQKSVH